MVDIDVSSFGLPLLFPTSLRCVAGDIVLDHGGASRYLAERNNLSDFFSRCFFKKGVAFLKIFFRTYYLAI